jgi:hypothetical protein
VCAQMCAARFGEFQVVSARSPSYALRADATCSTAVQALPALLRIVGRRLDCGLEKRQTIES